MFYFVKVASRLSKVTPLSKASDSPDVPYPSDPWLAEVASSHEAAPTARGQ